MFLFKKKGGFISPKNTVMWPCILITIICIINPLKSLLWTLKFQKVKKNIESNAKTKPKGLVPAIMNK